MARKRPPGCRPGRFELRPTLAAGVAWASGCSWPGICARSGPASIAWKRYSTFTEQLKETKRKLLEFLIQAKREGKSIAGYGAPGKGNTLLNYCGIRTDFIDYTVDRSF